LIRQESGYHELAFTFLSGVLVRNLIFSILIMQLLSATVCDTTVLAQEGASGNPNGTRKQSSGTNAIFLDKFPGIGRRQDFAQAMVEERAALRLMQDKQYDQAINRFKQAIQIYPNLPAAHMYIGQSIERMGGSDEEAESQYRAAIKLDNDDFRAWHKLAGLLYKRKKYVEARKAVAKAIMLNPPPRERKILDRMINMIDSAQTDGKVDEQDQN
jgi:tetratricopeptide (TPR) repeat protein